MIAALYVETGGAYFDLDSVDPWDEQRDARGYAGPHAVVAHPPCKRWGRYWGGGPSAKVKRVLGDDGGCFAAALASVQRWGGVVEHPEASHAWFRHGLNRPPRSGGWVWSGFGGGWTCCVEQGHYGHRARKATWLYVSGTDELPALRWGPASGCSRVDPGYHSAEERRESGGAPAENRLKPWERIATPAEFRELLLSIARSCR